MKTISFISVFILVMAGNSCYIDNLESIYGNGNVISEERTIEDFNGLKVSSGIDVILKQGPEVSLLLEADENLHEVIRTEVKDDQLKIYTTRNVRRSKAMKVYLSCKDLNSIRISSSGDVRGANTLHADRLNISLSSAGDLELDLEAEEVDCSISSSGDATLTGSTRLLKANLSSAGDLDAYGLEAGICRVNCSSAGDARIYATQEVDLSASSAGSIYYRGDARVTRSRTSSAGSIVKKGD